MTIKELCGKAGFEILTMPSPDAQVSGGYVGDLLSWVMGRAEEDTLWITIMSNVNIVAVAHLAGVSAVLVAEDAAVDAEVIKKAEGNGINLLRSPKNSFDAALLTGQLLGLV